MGKLFYAVSGEGRGHATRACTLIEDLRRDHQIVLYAPHRAWEMLAPRYRGTDVDVRPLPGMQFYYSADRRLDAAKTVWGNSGYISAIPELLRRLVREIEAERPDLVLTDFEPSLPRAARRVGVPFISLDHQHFLVTYDLSSLPLRLRFYAAVMAGVVHGYFRGQVHSIVSSFYFPPLRPGLTEVTQVGVLLRREILEAGRRDGSHLVAYLRRRPCSSVLEALAGCGCEVRVYGLGEGLSWRSLRFRPVDATRFVEDLAGSRALITTAGNQLVGEALYLGKPVLAMPEPGNREQEINAHFLSRSGAGRAISVHRLTSPVIRSFLDDAESLSPHIERRRLCGNPQTLEIIRDHLDSAAPEALRRRQQAVHRQEVVGQRKAGVSTV